MKNRRNYFYPTMRYQSNFPNEVHQLTITISRHLQLLKKGTFKYQEKPFDINWDKLGSIGKERDYVIHFVIRDHYSGFFYAETHPLSKIISLETFLHHAWAPKRNYPFFGLPKALFIQQHIIDFFPSIRNFIGRNNQLQVEFSTSGFQGGIVSVKNWEKDFINQVVYPILNEDPLLHSSLLNRFIYLNTLNFRYQYGIESSSMERYVTGLKETPTEYSTPSVTKDFHLFSELFDSQEIPKFQNTFTEMVFHIDLSKDVTEKDDFIKIEFKKPREQFDQLKALKAEIKGRPGYRSMLNQYRYNNFYVVYNALEYGIINPPEPWVIICERHGTKKFFPIISNALSVGRKNGMNTGRSFCQDCNLEVNKKGV